MKGNLEFSWCLHHESSVAVLLLTPYFPAIVSMYAVWLIFIVPSSLSITVDLEAIAPDKRAFVHLETEVDVVQIFLVHDMARESIHKVIDYHSNDDGAHECKQNKNTHPAASIGWDQQ